jgi:hypothetical protein
LEPSAAIKPIVSIINSDIDQFSVHRYSLLVEISNTNAIFLMLDTETMQYITIEQIAFNVATGETEAMVIFEQFYLTSIYRKIKYKRVAIIWCNEFFTFVPKAVFDQETMPSYLSLTTAIDISTSHILSHFELAIDCHLVYGFGAYTKTVIDNLLPDVKHFHSAGTLINALLTNYKNEHNATMIAHIKNGYFELAIIENRKLKYFNRFSFLTSEDVVYYSLNVCENLKISPEEIEFKIAGEIEKKSTVYNLLYKYFRNISTIPKSELYKLSAPLQSIPSHFYYNLFNSIHCVS